MRRYYRQSDKGFTIVELVIVIAVIAILAAVLIPTFSSVISKAEYSKDINTVSDINKFLYQESVTEKDSVTFAKAKQILIDYGINIPRSPKSNSHSFYWIPGDNRVVLYDHSSDKVVFPEESKEKIIDELWIDLSTESGAIITTTEITEETKTPEVSETAETTAKEPQETTAPEQTVFTLCKGSDFNSKITNSSPAKIIFGKTSDHIIKETDTQIELSEGIKGYIRETTLYVLCDGTILANQDCKDMFSGMKNLTSVEFDNFDTSSVTTMEKMFQNCSKIKSLDLSGFNISSVKNTENMFNGCSAIEKITVKTSENHWNIRNIEHGDYMFDGCTKLRNYSSGFSGLFEGFIKYLSGETPHDVGYANTSSNGYLTEA